jgi:hypothetical protein
MLNNQPCASESELNLLTIKEKATIIFAKEIESKIDDKSLPIVTKQLHKLVNGMKVAEIKSFTTKCDTKLIKRLIDFGEFTDEQRITWKLFGMLF